MNIKISPSKIGGSVAAPPSKSYTHRAVILASLAKGQSTIRNILSSLDTEITMQFCIKIGADLKRTKDTVKITGVDGFKNSQDLKPIEFSGKNSGTTIRLISSVASIRPETTKISADQRMQKRPMTELLDVLKLQGATIKDNNGFLPVEIHGGILKGGEIEISGKNSSQFISSLLMILPYAQKDSQIKVTDLKSKPYVDLTIDLMRQFGIALKESGNTYIVPRGRYKPANYTVEGDFSSASYVLAAAAVTGSNIKVKNLNLNSKQGDRKIVDILQMMGCKIERLPDGVSIKGKAKHAVSIDMGNYPDIVPTVSAIAATINGKTHINNIGHLRHKESNRIKTIQKELSKFGAKIESTQDSLTIQGGVLHGANIDTHNDHRIAMSMAVAALAAIGDTSIKNAQVVEKSYKHFWADFKKIGVHIL